MTRKGVTRLLCAVVMVGGWLGGMPGAGAARYGFETGEEDWTAQNWGAPKDKCTNVVQSSLWGYGGSTHSLRMDCVLTADGDTAVAGVSFEPQNLQGSQITMRVYCPTNSSGTHPQSWAWTQLRLWVKDAHYNYQETAWDAFKIPPGHSTQYVYHTVTGAGGFDSTNVAEFGLQVYWRGYGTYHGPLYVDEAGFGAPYQAAVLEVQTNDLRYGFETGKEGWLHETYVDPNPANSLTGIVAVSQSTNRAIRGTHGLRMDVAINQAGTNRQKGGAAVDMRWYPPEEVRAPFNLDGTTVYAYVYCPAGSESPDPADPNYLKLMVKSSIDGSNWYSQIGAPAAVEDDTWVELKVPVSSNTPPLGYMDAGFTPTSIVAVGVLLDLRGTYNGPLYLDNVCFHVRPEQIPQTLTNTQHDYDMEEASQQEWWKWDTNPEGWHAKAWTDVYYATNEGYNGSVALAANAAFVTNDSFEIVTNEFGQVVTNEFAFQKGVFEIAYQPALNLSTKDHRKIQAKLRFEPAVEGLLSFDASLNVFDKLTDQWYAKNFKVGGSGWNFLEFDLDDPASYDVGSPVPMNAEAIGFITLQLFANIPWSGTIYLDDVIVGGRETGTNYTLVTGGFVQPAAHKFVVDGSNFYHCGVNIEYLQTVPDHVVRECLDWAASNQIGVVRTWAMQEGRPYSFQPQRGVWNEVMFEHLDRIVAEAGHRGIRLMLDLVDNWAHNGGVFQYVHWVTREHPETVNTNLSKEGVLYHDQFWTNTYCKQWYKTYVTRLLNRTNTVTGRVYKDDPTIFAWEIVNEPRCESDFGGRTIHNWLHEMSDFVRTIDTNHILGNGEEGGYINTYDYADTVPWEVYPDNYYHYAVYATGSSTCDLYGCGRGHGVDFLSDNNDQSTLVRWQGGLYTNRDPVQEEWRSGNSNVNFCTARIYIDQKEYNVWRTNYNGADQRLEWINDHWYDAHYAIGKPMILEEFGIHGIGWVFNGSYGQVQLQRTPEYTFEDRVEVYELFYRHIENSGISAGYFWNFGYQGMWDDPFHLCETTAPWFASASNSAATSVSLSTDHVLQGTNALRLAWNVPSPAANTAIFQCPTNEKWLLRVDDKLTNDPPVHGINRTKFFWNFYNPSAQDVDVSLSLVGHAGHYPCETPPYTLTSGWNRILFDLSSGAWTWNSNGVVRTNYLIKIPDSVSNVLEDVHRVGLVFRDLPTGAGEVYIDDIQIKRDDGFVVYADDPVNPVIKAHAMQMNARNVATNDPANHVPVASNLTLVVHPKDPTPFTMGGADADGDFLSYRIIQRPTNGWVFGSPPGDLVYVPRLGAEGLDLFTYVVHDGKADSAEAVVNVQRASFEDVRYDFESGGEGWYANYHEWSGYAVTAVVQTAEQAFHGDGSLKALVDLYDTWPYSAGDAEVNMEYDPPAYVIAPVDLEGQTLTISVFCPAGSRGSPSNPNRIQIYAKDTSWLTEYTVEQDIVEERWVTISMVVATNAPPGGWMDAGFDPAAVRAIGVRLKCGGAGSEYEGPIYIDAATFPLMGKALYTFDEDLEGWTTEDWAFGHATLSWTNELGNPRAGAMVVTPVDGPDYGKFYLKDWDAVDNLDVSYTPILQTYIWVPCDAPANVHHAVRARLMIRSHKDGWSYGHQGEQQMLVPCQWNLLTWDMSGLPAEVLQYADEFGVELVWGNRDVWAGPVVVDSISVRPKTPEAAPEITSVTPATNAVGKYRKYEIAVGLDRVAGLNPYDPHVVDLGATFISPSGQVWNVNGFYMRDEDGDGTWRIRFAPNEIGAWSYSVRAGNAMGTNASPGHGFTCVASDRHGWVRVSDDDAHYLEHDDDHPFIGIGYCRCWDGDDEGFFEEAEEHGINMIHWWMAPWDTMLTVKPANPEETWREKSSYDTYEQGRAAELDRIVGHAEQHNVKLVFTIWPHDAIRDFNYHKWRINGSWQKAFDYKFSEPEWYINAFSELDDPPRNQKFFHDEVYKEYQDRLYRYIIARWGYSEAIGCWALVSEMFGTFANSANCIRYQDPLYVTNKNALFGENPYLNMDTNQCDGADYTVPWLTYINDYFKNNDPFEHPTTASYATDEYWDGGFPVIDMPQVHTYADLYSWLTPPETLAKYHHHLAAAYDKPAFMGEIGTVEWKHFEPDFTRVTAWPGICSGAAITPMMWTTPPFSWFGDAKMGPWLGTMSDEMKVLSKFLADIEFHKLDLSPAAVAAHTPDEPGVTLVEGFEGGFNSWSLWGHGATNMTVVTNHATEGSHCLKLDINMDTYANMPDAPSGIEKYESDGFSYDWSAYWPHGTVKLDVFVPEFYHPEENPEGFLLGINKDPRSILEVFTRDEGGGWHWYSTTNVYGGEGREGGGWKKLTVGMEWNLELNLGVITSAYEAAHVSGFKFKFGDVGILRGPIYLDRLTAGLYAFNTYGLVSSDGTFAFAWIQDRRWTNAVTTNAVFEIEGLAPGTYDLEWWSTLSGIRAVQHVDAAKGDISVAAPSFVKDAAVKIRRVGSVGATVHDVAIGAVQEYDWVVKSLRQRLGVLVINQGTAAETFTVTLTDTTDGRVIGTNSLTLGAGALTNTIFYWNNTNATMDVVHTLVAQAATVPGETDTADNALAGKTRLCAEPPPWDPCDRLLRWAPDANDSDGRELVVSTDYVTEGGEAFRFYHRSLEKEQAYFGFDQIYESWEDRRAFIFDLYNADGSTHAQVLVRTGDEWSWYYSKPLAITSGWNRDLVFDFTTNTWTKSVWNDVTQSNDYYHDVMIDGLDQMQQIFIKVSGYVDDGYVYVDNIRLDGDYVVHLAYENGIDYFPQAVAGRSNYTGAACCWMIARYLNGESFDRPQDQIYAENAHAPDHNGEITHDSCARWMVSNIVAGFYFDDRAHTNLANALKESVYWMDYIPPGGLKTPVYILCGTNWSYKVIRGFQTDRKPYDGSGWGPWNTNVFTVHGMWLNDPAMGGLGYNVYATAEEMASIYLPSTAGGTYWLVAEPPEDEAEILRAADRMDSATMLLGRAEPNPAAAAFLQARFGRSTARARSAGPARDIGWGGDPVLLASVPRALREDEGFMTAFNAGGVVSYYAVNTNRPDRYFLAAGAARGPGSTRYVLKLGEDGSLQQATWCAYEAFYQPLPLASADWAARRQFDEGATVTLESNELVAGESPFMPQWEFVYDVDGESVFTLVKADVDLGGDADGDGMSDGDELYAGFDPDDGVSVFSVEGGTLRSLGPDKLVVQWPSSGDRTYGVYRAEQIGQPFTRIAGRVAGTPPMNAFTDTVSSATAFYRVRVE